MTDPADNTAAAVEKLKTLLHRIATSPVAQRENLAREAAQELNETEPQMVEMIAKWGRDGLPLEELFKFAFGSVLSRADLADEEKLDAFNDAIEFKACLNVIRATQRSLVSKEIAIRLAMSALIVGLRSGLKPEEIDMVLRGLQSKRGKQSASRRKQKHARWAAQAELLTNEVRKEHPKYSQERVADAIMERWSAKAEDKPPGRRSLVRLISKLGKAGESLPHK